MDHRLGWNSHFQQVSAGQLDQVARILSAERGQYRICMLETGTEAWAELLGSYRHRSQGTSEYPAVGDWVIIDIRNGHYIINKILPRTSLLQRKEAGSREDGQILAANVDVALIVCACDRNFSRNRIERYLALVGAEDVDTVVLLSKSDLFTQDLMIQDDIDALRIKVRVILYSAQTGENMEQVESLFEPGKTYVVLGSSGAGKSTLINHLTNAAPIKTQSVREGDAKGRHTTTRREMHFLPNGAIVMDTPGMRELQLLDHQEGLDTAFPQILELALHCRFTDCQHRSERDCAVKQAISSGVLSQEQLEHYHKLEAELAARARRAQLYRSHPKKRR